MKDLKNVLIAGGSALALALSLGACGGSEPTPAADDTTEAEPAAVEEPVAYSTDAVVDPADINPGWVVDSADKLSGTSDVWVPAAGSSTDTLYFTNAANDAGMDVSFMASEDSEDNVWDLEIADGHLVTKADASDKRQVDITFQDNFTCYDAVTQTTYVRGDGGQDYYDTLFEGKSFVEDASEPQKYEVTFNAGGTVERIMNGEAVEGTWAATAVNVAEIHYVAGSSEWDEQVRLILDDTGNVTELDDGWSSMPLYEE